MREILQAIIDGKKIEQAPISSPKKWSAADLNILDFINYNYKVKSEILYVNKTKRGEISCYFNKDQAVAGVGCNPNDYDYIAKEFVGKC